MNKNITSPIIGFLIGLVLHIMVYKLETSSVIGEYGTNPFMGLFMIQFIIIEIIVISMIYFLRR
jgi:hypothetical protein